MICCNGTRNAEQHGLIHAFQLDQGIDHDAPNSYGHADCACDRRAFRDHGERTDRACTRCRSGRSTRTGGARATRSPATSASSVEYIFRGISQTAGKPAVQGGFDYTHSSGFYLGTWASNVSWLEDFGAYSRSSLEWDFYGGYKANFRR